MLKVTSNAYLTLIEEKAILEKRTESLEEFVKIARRGEAAKELELTLSEIELLEEQLHYMRGYLRVLNQRIANVKS